LGRKEGGTSEGASAEVVVFGNPKVGGAGGTSRRDIFTRGDLYLIQVTKKKTVKRSWGGRRWRVPVTEEDYFWTEGWTEEEDQEQTWNWNGLGGKRGRSRRWGASE